MNIAVCLKWVPDTKIRIDLDPENLRPDPYDLVYEMNPNDRIPLWASLGLRERLGAQVTVVSLGPNHSRSMLLQALVLGADQAILIPSSEEITQDPREIAGSLCRALKSLDVSLVLFGDESCDEMRGHVGPLLAERLGFNLVTSVINIEDVDAGNRRIRVKKSLGSGWVKILECAIPVVLTFVTRETPGVIHQTFRNDLATELSSLAARIFTFQPSSGSNDDYDSEEGYVSAKHRLSLARRRPQMVPCPDPRSPASERIESIFAWGGQRKAGGIILQGSPEDVAQELIKILDKQGHLPDSFTRHDGSG